MPVPLFPQAVSPESLLSPPSWRCHSVLLKTFAGYNQSGRLSNIALRTKVTRRALKDETDVDHERIRTRPQKSSMVAKGEEIISKFLPFIKRQLFQQYRHRSLWCRLACESRADSPSPSPLKIFLQTSRFSRGQTKTRAYDQPSRM